MYFHHVRIRVMVIALICAVLAGPAGGFLFGFVTCPDCGYNVLGRAFIGCIMAVITPLTFGFPPRNESGVGDPYNAWPYIFIAWLVLFALVMWLDVKRTRKKQAIPPRITAL